MKRAFTLTELLIAMAVIAVLAGILIPVIGIVRRQAKDVQCRNNLQQLFTGITGFRQDNNQAFPAKLGILFSPGQSLAGESLKLLLCPHDGSHGTDVTCGRNPYWDKPYVNSLDRLFEPGSSYFFEVSGKPLETPESNWTFADNDSDPNNNPPWDGDGRSTWWQAKAYQLRKGNVGMTAFNEADFPIVRCFKHYSWVSAPLDVQVKNVVNLAWDGSIFLSIPYWEHQANPSIPLPPP